jgi:Cu-processing system permease protein
MFGRVGAIALNTYRESVRARILLGLAGIALAVSIYSLIVGAYALKNAARVVSDLGAASISIFSIAVVVIIGATSLHRELEQKTLFPILARPIRRSEYLAGKYLGTLLTIAVFIMADAGVVLMLGASLAGRSIGLILGSVFGWLAVMGVVAWRVPVMRTYGPIPWAAGMFVLGMVLAQVSPDERQVVVVSCVLTLFEIGIVAALVTLFASFSTPFLSALFALGIFIAGRSADSMARVPVRTFGQLLHDIFAFVSKIVPNLQIYVPPRPLLLGEVASVKLSTYIGMASLTSIGWSLGLLALAVMIFNKRDFL